MFHRIEAKQVCVHNYNEDPCMVHGGLARGLWRGLTQRLAQRVKGINW